MVEEVSQTVMEIVAILLTLLFIAVQYATRKESTNHVSSNTLAGTLNKVAAVAFFLIFTSFVASMNLLDIYNDSRVTLLLAPLFFAFLYIGIAIRQTAFELAENFDPKETTAGFKKDDDQLTLEEFEK